MEEPNRNNFENLQEWMKARQKWLIEKNKKLLESIDAPKVNKRIQKGCDIIYGEPEDEKDILLKFRRKNYQNMECIYLSSFKKQYVNNICNIYILWKRKNLMNEIDDQGHNSAPIVKVENLLSIFTIAGECSNISWLLWQIPLFGKSYFSMETLLKIQKKINKNKKNKSITLDLINITEQTNLKNSETNNRLGNIYGEFGIGQIHGQKNNINIYTINDVKLTSLSSPKDGIIDFSILHDDLETQLYAREKINQFDFDMENDEIPELLTNQYLEENNLCPSTETILSNGYDMYNSHLLEKLNDDYNELSYDLSVSEKMLFQNAINELTDIEENMTLKEKQEVIIKNQKIEKQIFIDFKDYFTIPSSGSETISSNENESIDDVRNAMDPDSQGSLHLSDLETENLEEVFSPRSRNVTRRTGIATYQPESLPSTIDENQSVVSNSPEDDEFLSYLPLTPELPPPNSGSRGGNKKTIKKKNHHYMMKKRKIRKTRKNKKI